MARSSTCRRRNTGVKTSLSSNSKVTVGSNGGSQRLADESGFQDWIAWNSKDGDSTLSMPFLPFSLFVFFFFGPYWTDDDEFSIKARFTTKRSSRRRVDKASSRCISDRAWDCLLVAFLESVPPSKTWSRHSYARMMHSTFSRTNRHFLTLTMMLVFRELLFVG